MYKIVEVYNQGDHYLVQIQEGPNLILRKDYFSSFLRRERLLEITGVESFIVYDENGRNELARRSNCVYAPQLRRFGDVLILHVVFVYDQPAIGYKGRIVFLDKKTSLNPGDIVAVSTIDKHHGSIDLSQAKTY